MTRLELVNMLRRECSVAGNAVPTTLNQTGEFARLISWIDIAYEEIQSEFNDWFFLRRKGVITTVADQDSVTPPSDLSTWDVERFYIDTTSQLDVMDYADYYPVTQNSGKPSSIVVMNDNTLKLCPTPDTAYSIDYDYFAVPHTLTSDNDEPLIPSQFQRVIVARAMMLYGNYEEAQEMVRQGGELYRMAIRQLRNHQTRGKRGFYGQADPLDIRVVAE